MNDKEYQDFWKVIVQIVDDYRGETINLDFIDFEDEIKNAYYAALVEYLTNERGEIPADWVSDKKYFLKDPVFLSNFKNFEYRVLTMIETPLEFKTRNIYIGENTFFRY